MVKDEFQLALKLAKLYTKNMMEELASVQPINLDPETLKVLFGTSNTAASVSYVDETWMLINGYVKKSEKHGCTGLLHREWWEKIENT